MSIAIIDSLDRGRGNFEICLRVHVKLEHDHMNNDDDGDDSKNNARCTSHIARQADDGFAYDLVIRSYTNPSSHKTAGASTSAVIRSIPPPDDDDEDGCSNAPAWPGSCPGSSHVPLMTDRDQ